MVLREVHLPPLPRPSALIFTALQTLAPTTVHLNKTINNQAQECLDKNGTLTQFSHFSCLESCDLGLDRKDKIVKIGNLWKIFKTYAANNTLRAYEVSYNKNINF